MLGPISLRSGLVETYKREKRSEQGKESNKGDDRQNWSPLEFRINAIP